MEIKLTERASTWFEENFPLEEGEAVRFFGKTYGETNVHEGFSIGVQVDSPENHEGILGSTEINNRQYFTTIRDVWFFEEYDLEIDIGEQYKEPTYYFTSGDSSEQTAKPDSVSSASKKDTE